MDFEYRGTVRRALLHTGKREADIPHGVEVDYVTGHCQHDCSERSTIDLPQPILILLVVTPKRMRSHLPGRTARDVRSPIVPAVDCGRVTRDSYNDPQRPLTFVRIADNPPAGPVNTTALLGSNSLILPL